MTKRIIYTRADGGVSVLNPAPNGRRENESDSDWLARIIAKDVPQDATGVRIVDESEIPTDRTFRNAWKADGESLVTDMARAREIHMARIRDARNKELSRLDIEQLKGNDVSTRKQELRDLPNTFDLFGASTADALKALWPTDLPK
jgi:hypothetical protein